MPACNSPQGKKSGLVLPANQTSAVSIRRTEVNRLAPGTFESNAQSRFSFAGICQGGETRMSSSELERLVRLANRITYGANRQLMQTAETLGYEAFVDWQLDDEAFDDSELQDLLASLLPTLAMDTQALYNHVFEQENFGAPQRDLLIATLIRRAFSPRQLFERMVEFWSDHFSVPANGLPLALFKFIEDRDLIRSHAMGRFETLLQHDARSPAMLFYLDNFSNTADGPNENYARELLELHTLSVDGGYTEDDIKEIARVFTGWSIRLPGEFIFKFFSHDWASKQVLGQQIQPTGVDEGERVLSMLAAHPSTARHIVIKLARRFSADLPAARLIDDVTETFVSTHGDIRESLRRLLLHPLVTETPALKFKRPNEFACGLVRTLETELTERSLLSTFETLNSAGHVPFGWPAPDGYPDHRSYWQSTNGLLVRFNSAAAWTEQLGEQSAVLRQAAAIPEPIAQIEFLSRTLRPQGLEPSTRRRMLRYANRLDERERPAALAAWLLSGPEAQWR